MEGYGTQMGNLNTGYAGVSSRATEIRPPAPDCLQTHMDELARVISTLEDELNGLAQALVPITKPLQQAVAKDGGVPTPIRSPLSNQATEQVGRLRLMARRVRELRESIDL